MRWSGISGLLLLTGCTRLDAAESLTAPLVAQGLYLGLDLGAYNIEPEEGTDLLNYSAACLIFLAYLSDPTALEESPLEGADISFRSAENDPLPLDDQGDGKYLLTAESGLRYESNDRAVVRTEVDGRPAEVSVDTPTAPDVELPPLWTPRTEFEVDISGQGYDNLIVAVFDVDRSKLTWDNLPVTVTETYEYTHVNDPIQRQIVPGDAIPGEGTFLVGVAGMRMAQAATFDGVNQVLSAFMAGQFSLHLMITQNE